MLELVSSNKPPKISSLSVRRHAMNEAEAEEIFAQNSTDSIIPIDVGSMPYTEFQTEIPEDDRPTIKKFSPDEKFKLSIYNFAANPEVPFIGFSIERAAEADDEDIYIEGSTIILDPSGSGITKPAIAAVPLLHVFNQQIRVEAKRAGDLIAKASGKQGTISLAAERDKRMMDAALTATHNVMQGLYGEEEDRSKTTVEQPKTGTDCLVSKLSPTLNASSSFYDALMNRVCDLFSPSIRTLAENVALGRIDPQI